MLTFPLKLNHYYKLKTGYKAILTENIGDIFFGRYLSGTEWWAFQWKKNGVDTSSYSDTFNIVEDWPPEPRIPLEHYWFARIHTNWNELKHPEQLMGPYKTKERRQEVMNQHYHNNTAWTLRPFTMKEIIDE